MTWLFTQRREKNSTISLFVAILLILTNCNGNNEIEEIERTHKNGTPKLIVIYNEIGSKKIKTKETHFHENGSIKMAGFFAQNQRDGIWKAYFDDGKVQSECYYKNGLKHGPIKIWNKNGTVMYQGQFNNNHKIGEWNFFDGGGNHVKSEIYKLPTQ